MVKEVLAALELGLSLPQLLMRGLVARLVLATGTDTGPITAVDSTEFVVVGVFDAEALQFEVDPVVLAGDVGTFLVTVARCQHTKTGSEEEKKRGSPRTAWPSKVHQSRPC